MPAHDHSQPQPASPALPLWGGAGAAVNPANGLGVDVGAQAVNSANLATLLRRYQAMDPVLGTFFEAMHTFIDRTIEEFFYDVEMPQPVLEMQKGARKKLGYYTTKDGYTLNHRVNVNPYAHRNGAEAAETVAHELVHMWQVIVGRPCVRGYHSEEFHKRMADMGIVTSGRAGRHDGYTHGEWQAWMEVNDDLHLESFILPGMNSVPAKKGTRLFKHQCPKCKASFRSRKPLDVRCNTCAVIFEVTQ